MSSRKNRDRRQERIDRGNRQLLKDRNKTFDGDWALNEFEPKHKQKDCCVSIDENTFTVIDGPSGVGKTTVSLWCSLHALKNREINQLLFIKNPTEVGDDKIGFLSGDEQDKLSAHMDTTKRIFYTFITKNKLECDMSKERIRLTIPNFVLGSTWDNAIVILDEVQLMSPKTVKLLLERCGKNTRYIIIGDSAQSYAVTKRSDGFSDLIERVTVPIPHSDSRASKYPETFGYIKLTPYDNQRSDGSRLINTLYGDL